MPTIARPSLPSRPCLDFDFDFANRASTSISPTSTLPNFDFADVVFTFWPPRALTALAAPSSVRRLHVLAAPSSDSSSSPEFCSPTSRSGRPEL